MILDCIDCNLIDMKLQSDIGINKTAFVGASITQSNSVLGGIIRFLQIACTLNLIDMHSDFGIDKKVNFLVPPSFSEIPCREMNHSRLHRL